MTELISMSQKQYELERSLLSPMLLDLDQMPRKFVDLQSYLNYYKKINVVNAMPPLTREDVEARALFNQLRGIETYSDKFNSVLDGGHYVVFNHVISGQVHTFMVKKETSPLRNDGPLISRSSIEFIENMLMLNILPAVHAILLSDLLNDSPLDKGFLIDEVVYEDEAKKKEIKNKLTYCYSSVEELAPTTKELDRLKNKPGTSYDPTSRFSLQNARNIFGKLDGAKGRDILINAQTGLVNLK